MNQTRDLKKTATLAEHKVRLEQKLLSSYTPQLRNTLEKIRQCAMANRSVPQTIFICYERSKDKPYLHWAEEYIKLLIIQLKFAGMYLLDTTYSSSVGHNPYEHLAKISHADIVLVIGTEAMGEDLFGLEASQRTLLERRKKDVSKKTLSIMLSGTPESVSAFFLTGESVWLNLGKSPTYFQHFQDLISLLYGTDDTIFKSLWNEFIVSLPGDSKNKVINGLLTSEIKTLLKKEEKETIDLELAKATASNALLFGRSRETKPQDSFVSQCVRSRL